MRNYICLFLLAFLSNSVYGQYDTNVKHYSRNDHTEINKIEVMSKSFDDFVKFQSERKNEVKSIWDTLIPLLIGAGLTLVTQILLESRKSREGKKLEILMTKTELDKIKYLLKDNYRELAMHKAHKFYWYALFEREIAKNNADKTEADKLYSSHVNSSNKVRETESKLSDNFAEYCKLISKLQRYTKFNEKVKEFLKEYQEYKPQKPQHLVPTYKDDLRVLEREEEDRLLNEYQPYIDIIEKINNELT